ncbi:hypothetical protein CJP72_19270 [Citrobacter sp. NCU1]|nr:hypothetical protein [Citrobacter sp. NCU1]
MSKAQIAKVAYNLNNLGYKKSASCVKFARMNLNNQMPALMSDVLRLILPQTLNSVNARGRYWHSRFVKREGNPKAGIVDNQAALSMTGISLRVFVSADIYLSLFTSGMSTTRKVAREQYLYVVAMNQGSYPNKTVMSDVYTIPEPDRPENYDRIHRIFISLR